MTSVIQTEQEFGIRTRRQADTSLSSPSPNQVLLAEAPWTHPKFCTLKNNATLAPNRLVIRLIPLMPSLIHSGQSLEQGDGEAGDGMVCGERGGLAGLHRAKALCLVSLGETTVAPPSERDVRVGKEEGICGVE
ncbi:hypothetical protein WMY93_023411 [Mugilogobius chulae]|uniref:Uncharacterized protein n=1 Tax=Mugilogobius chulae TaxID=88201 RepID=A0AAW0N477_9GOBI